MLYWVLAILPSFFSALGIVFLFVHLSCVHDFGIERYETAVNEKFAGKKFLSVLVQIVCYASLLSYAVFVFPLVDALTFNVIAFPTAYGMETGLFGSFGHPDIALYILLILVNLAGIRPALKLAKIAGFLRHGYIYIIPAPLFGLTWKRRF